MKKVLFLGFILNLLTHSSYGQEYPVLGTDVVKSFPMGEGENQIGTIQGDLRGYSGRTNPALGWIGNRIIIDDFFNKRIFVLDDQFDIAQAIPYHGELEASYLTEMGDGLLSIYHKVFGIDFFEDFKLKASIPVDIGQEFFKELARFRSFEFFENVLFIHDQNLKIWSFVNPGLNQTENRKALLNEAKTREYVLKRWGAKGEVRIDEAGRLFVQGNFVTKDYNQFFEYVRDYHGGMSISDELKKKGYQPILGLKWNNWKYIGRDNRVFFYWNIGDFIRVINSEYTIVKDFKILIPNFASIPPVVTDKGEIYFLNYNEKNVLLYQVKRDW